MEIVEKDDEIVLRDVPITNWIQGLLLIFGFVLFAAPVVRPLRKSNQMVDFGLLFCAAFSVFALYLAYVKLSAPLTITRVKPDEQIIEVAKQKFLIKKTEFYNFEQIERFKMVRRKLDRAYVYFHTMILNDGTYIDLESTGSASENVSMIPGKLNDLLKKYNSEQKQAEKRAGK